MSQDISGYLFGANSQMSAIAPLESRSPKDQICGTHDKNSHNSQVVCDGNIIGYLKFSCMFGLKFRCDLIRLCR
jgi:hypothetical protein